MQLPDWLIILQVLSNCAIVATFIIYWGQLKAMRDSSLAQNLISVNQFMLDPTFRDARMQLFVLSDNNQLSLTLTDDAQQVVDRVCASWNFVALLVDKKVLPFFVLEEAKYSFLKCHRICEPILTEVRKTRAPDLWHHFTEYANKLSIE